MGKFLSFIVLLFFLLLLIGGGIWLNKIKNSEPDGPRIEELRVCGYVSYNAPCDTDSKTISQENGDIFATVKATDITNSVMKTKWEYVQDNTKSVIGEAEANIYNNETYQLKLEKNLKSGWLLGKYIVTIILEGSNTLTKEFTIVAE